MIGGLWVRPSAPLHLPRSLFPRDNVCLLARFKQDNGKKTKSTEASLLKLRTMEKSTRKTLRLKALAQVRGGTTSCENAANLVLISVR